MTHDRSINSKCVACSCFWELTLTPRLFCFNCTSWIHEMCYNNLAVKSDSDRMFHCKKCMHCQSPNCTDILLKEEQQEATISKGKRQIAWLEKQIQATQVDLNCVARQLRQASLERSELGSMLADATAHYADHWYRQQVMYEGAEDIMPIPSVDETSGEI